MKQMLEILLIASSFPRDSEDWRAVFMRQMADALGRHPSIHPIVWAPPGNLGPGVSHDLRGNEGAWLARLMEKGGIAHMLRNQPSNGVLAGIGLLRRLRRVYRRNNQVDIRHINWLQNALSVPHDGIPLLVTVLGSDLALLKWAPVRIAVRRTLKTRRAIVCPNSSWMIAPLQEALGHDIDIREIPFGIDARWYCVERRPLSKPHRWLAVTRLTRAKIGDLFDWGVKWFSQGKRELHLFGPMQESVELPNWVKYHGPATPTLLHERWFPEVSGLITLSRHDEGRPQILLEAMASGLPIIASNIAAHTNFLQHRETAWLCGDDEEFGKGLTYLEDESNNMGVGKAAHLWALENIGTWDDCAKRYYALYHELLVSANE